MELYRLPEGTFVIVKAERVLHFYRLVESDDNNSSYEFQWEYKHFFT